MQKLLLILFFILTIGVTAHAQGPGPQSQLARKEYSGTAIPNWNCSPGPIWRDIYIRTTDNSEWQCSALNTWTKVVSGGTPGTVTTFSAGDLPPLFITTETNPTTTPALSFTLSNAAAHKFFGNNTGSTAAPGFQSIGTGDLPTGIPAANLVDGSVSDAQLQFINTATSNVQTQIDGKQPLNANLTTIAGLGTPTTDDFMVGVSNLWAKRTVAQVKITLALNLVDNTSDASKPVSTATQTALDLKANLAGNNAFAGQQTIGVGGDSSALDDLTINPTTKTSGNLLRLRVNSVDRFLVSAVGLLTHRSTASGSGLETIAFFNKSNALGVGLTISASDSQTVIAADWRSGGGNVAVVLSGINSSGVNQNNITLNGNNAGATIAGDVTAPSYSTATNCADSAGAAACGSAAAGHFVIDAAATTVVVSTDKVTANSEIMLTRDDSAGTRLGVTCNTQSSLTLGTPRITARTAGTSFTVTIEAGPTTNPMCLSYYIIN